MKVNEAGEVLWQKGYTDGISSSFTDFTPLSEGGFAVSGLYQAGGVVTKIKNDGLLEWARVYNTNRIPSIFGSSDGGIFMAVDNLILRTDPAGSCCFLKGDAQISQIDPQFQISALTLMLYTYIDSPQIDARITHAVATSTSVVPMDACPKTLTVTKSGNGSGTVFATGALFGTEAGFDCGNVCEGTFDIGSTVTLTAAPDGASIFSGGAGDCSSCGSNTTCDITMDADKSCAATFAQNPPSSEAIFQKGPDMNVARMAHNAATLPDGRVAVFGGHGTGFISLSTAEIFSPTTGTFTTFQMNYPHDTPAFVKLLDGTYLIAGGSSDLGVPSYAESEVFDPTTNTFTPVGKMVRFRAGAGGATMSNGKALIASAWWTHNDAYRYGEVYDPTTRTFSATQSFSADRSYAIVLPTSDGKAVVMGGMSPTGSQGDQPVELFDPSTGEITKLRNTLFQDESGWLIHAYRGFPSSDVQRMPDGRYLFIAWKNTGGVTSYRLFAFNPETKGNDVITTYPSLPDSRTATWFYQPVVDTVRNKAYILASLPPESDNKQIIALYVLDLNTFTLSRSSNSYKLQDYYLGGSSTVLLNDGRLMVLGGTLGDNFSPVSHTLFITPQTAQPSILYEISGVAKDPDGSPIGRVVVRLYDEGGSLVKEVTTSGNGSFSISLTEEGFYTITFEKEGYSLLNPPQVIYLSTDQPKVSLNLIFSPSPYALMSFKKGWNFISFPKLPPDTSLSSIFGDKPVRIVWGYDNETKRWKRWRPDLSFNTLSAIEPKKGYWVYADEPFQIETKDWIELEDKTITLYPNWNLIGWLGEDKDLSSIGGSLILIWTWEDGTWYGKHTSLNLPYPELTTLKKGKAYWIKVTGVVEWNE